MTVRLLKDRTSQCFADEHEWLYAPSEVEYVAFWEADNANYVRFSESKRASQWKPIPRPWEAEKKAPVMGADRRTRLREHAKRMTGKST